MSLEIVYFVFFGGGFRGKVRQVCQVGQVRQVRRDTLDHVGQVRQVRRDTLDHVGQVRRHPVHTHSNMCNNRTRVKPFHTARINVNVTSLHLGSKVFTDQQIQ